MAFLEQPSTQLPHRMHSPSSISARWTMALTSKLMGQLRVQAWQLEQLAGSRGDRVVPRAPIAPEDGARSETGATSSERPDAGLCYSPDESRLGLDKRADLW